LAARWDVLVVDDELDIHDLAPPLALSAQLALRAFTLALQEASPTGTGSPTSMRESLRFLEDSKPQSLAS
jgi:hypothetical protein